MIEYYFTKIFEKVWYCLIVIKYLLVEELYRGYIKKDFVMVKVPSTKKKVTSGVLVETHNTKSNHTISVPKKT